MHHIFRLETEIQTGYQERVHSIGFITLYLLFPGYYCCWSWHLNYNSSAVHTIKPEDLFLIQRKYRARIKNWKKTNSSNYFLKSQNIPWRNNFWREL